MDYLHHSINDPSSSDPSDVFRALSDVTRLRLVQLLLLEELNVTELVEILALPQSTISRQLKTLRDSGLVFDRRVGVASLHTARSYPHNDSDSSSETQLTPLLMQWLEKRPLPSGLLERLDRVIKQRGNDAAGFFNRIGRRWDELREDAFGSHFALEAFVSLLPADWTVADIGTGTGHLLPMLAAHFREVIAIEPAESMLECARQRLARFGLTQVELRSGDLTNLPMADASVDLAIAMLVLHHVPNVGDALREMSRIVKPRGRILIVEQKSHENQAFYERMQDHWWGFDPAEIQQRLIAAGCADLVIRDLRTADSDERSPDAPALFVITASRCPS